MGNKKISLLNLFLSILLLIQYSCARNSSEKVSKKDKYFETENQYWIAPSLTHYRLGINYTATVVPNDYFIPNPLFVERNGEIDVSKERVVEFIFLQEEDKNLLEQRFTGKSYTEGVKYLSFAIRDDFYLVASTGDTIPCIGVHFERNFKITPYKKALLYFDIIPSESTISLVYNDSLFGAGKLLFNFKEKPIKI